MAERHLLYQSAERHFYVIRVLYTKMEISEMIWQKKSEVFRTSSTSYSCVHKIVYRNPYFSHREEDKNVSGCPCSES